MIRTKLAAFAFAALVVGAVACGGGGDSTGPTPAPQTATIRLLNESSVPIVAVYFTACSESTWGSNRLGASETLAPGALRTWTVEPGCYDLRASTGSKTASWFDRDVAAGGAIQLAVPAEVAAVDET
jgi:hypothetical protein